jgi:hypothetical protein
MEETKPVYVLRTCREDLTSYGGFQWPSHGYVEAPDWDPSIIYGGGLHGLLWGNGWPGFLSWEPEAKWLVVRVDVPLFYLGNNEIKFQSGYVEHCGNQKSAIEFIISKGVDPNTVVGNFVKVGDYQTAVTGHYSNSVTGDRGKAISDDESASVSGVEGISVSGVYGISDSGIWGVSVAGYSGSARSDREGISVSGMEGSSASGDDGVSVVNYKGNALAGDRGIAVAKAKGTARAGKTGIALAAIKGMAAAGEGGVMLVADMKQEL